MRRRFVYSLFLYGLKKYISVPTRYVWVDFFGQKTSVEMYVSGRNASEFYDVIKRRSFFVVLLSLQPWCTFEQLVWPEYLSPLPDFGQRPPTMSYEAIAQKSGRGETQVKKHLSRYIKEAVLALWKGERLQGQYITATPDSVSLSTAAGI
mgnify:FL=1